MSIIAKQPLEWRLFLALIFGLHIISYLPNHISFTTRSINCGIMIQKERRLFMSKREHNLKIVLVLLASLIFIGTAGYKILLKLNLIDALYMTVITISTVGYKEVSVMNNAAKMFSIVLILMSLGTVGYLFSTIVSLFIERDWKQSWRNRIMQDKISKMSNHYIICGAGETGYNAIKQFVKSNAAFVVIDKSQERVNELLSENIPTILGDASLEETLKKANIHDSKGLVSSLSSDAENLYTVLTARQMNSDLYIVSKAINKYADEKLKKAGANNTISPDEIGGSRMASLMLRPHVISFLDVITRAGGISLDLEEVTIHAESTLIHKNLRESKIPEKTGLIILAIKKHDQDKLSFNPSSDELLEKGDIMIVLGDKEQVENLRNIAKDSTV